MSKSYKSSTPIDPEVKAHVLSASQVVMCKVCFERPASEFVSVTLERVTSDRIVYQLLQLEICEQCAQPVNANMASGERMAQALASGA